VSNLRDEPVPIHAALPEEALPKWSRAGERRARFGHHKIREENEAGHFQGLSSAPYFEQLVDEAQETARQAEERPVFHVIKPTRPL
jgi:hypothetical protein